MSDVAKVIESKSNKATLWGIITIILGVLSMGAPLATGLAVALLLGGILVVTGIAQTIYAFQAQSMGRGILRLLFGGVTLIAGLVIIAQPGMALATLTLFLAAYFAVDGLVTIFASFQVSKGKGWLLFNGILTLILGVLIWRGWPASTVVVVGVLVGIRLVVAGMTMMALGSVGRQVSEAIPE